ncbi:MAG: translation elongation factor Ts [Thermoanaerobaculia bacterium]
MAQIDAALVKELREKTGAGMMDCKAALTESNGNIEEAVKILRKKGLAAAGKKAGRIASEGIAFASIEGASGILIEVNCETDFVAQTDDFKALVAGIAGLVRSENPAEVEQLLALKWPGDAEGHTVAQHISGKIAKIGENIAVRRFIKYDASGAALSSYIHGNGKIGVMVEVKVDKPEATAAAEALAKEVAMHVAAAEPRFLHREEVTAKDLETEKEVARDQALKSGKPEAVVEKIVTGKMDKYYAETVLLEQAYIRDDKMTVQKLVDQRGKEAGAKFEVSRFTRFKLGEGIEKKANDFVAEVMAQASGN